MDLLTTRQQKGEVESVDELLEHLYELLPKENDHDLLDGLYSKRYRKQVWGIVERMMSPDYVEVSSDAASLNGGAISKMRKEMRSLARARKILIEHEKEYGVEACDRGWRRSICYPLPRDSMCDLPNLQPHLYKLYSKLGWLVSSGRGMRPRDDDSNDNIPDVVSLLTLGGTLVDQAEHKVVVEADTFKGKYVLVFCMNAPVLFRSDGRQSIFNLCNELCSYSKSREIEMVMVARMNILADEKEVFEHLFSGFPESCLAVPYDDREQRERIWKLLNGSSSGIRCSVFETNGDILTSFCVDSSINRLSYGAEAFPFDKETLEKTDAERKRLRKEGSLEELLRPAYESSSKDFYVHELNRRVEKKRLSEVIKNKHVGLLVCCTCVSLLVPLVQKVYEQQCKIKGQEFEIVVLFLPLLSEVDPQVFQEKMESSWWRKNIRGWWCLPFNNSVSLRFLGLTKDADCGYNNDEEMEDKLIIVGPKGDILDMYGAQVLGEGHHGSDTFPFTREAVVLKKRMQLEGLTLESHLAGQLFCRGNDPSDTISTDELLSSKKKIVICLGAPQYNDFHGLVSRYEKADRSKFEVVFIEFPPYQYQYPTEAEVGLRRAGEGEGEGEWYMPWYVHCRRDGSYTSLAEELKELVSNRALVGFGEDGRICSLKVLSDLVDVGEDHDLVITLKQLDDEGRGGDWTWDLCLDDTLDKDIYHHMFRYDWYAEI